MAISNLSLFPNLGQARRRRGQPIVGGFPAPPGGAPADVPQLPSPIVGGPLGVEPQEGPPLPPGVPSDPVVPWTPQQRLAPYQSLISPAEPMPEETQHTPGGFWNRLKDAGIGTVLMGPVGGIASAINPQMAHTARHRLIDLPLWQERTGMLDKLATSRLNRIQDVAQITGLDPLTGQPTDVAGRDTERFENQRVLEQLRGENRLAVAQANQASRLHIAMLNHQRQLERMDHGAQLRAEARRRQLADQMRMSPDSPEVYEQLSRELDQNNAIRAQRLTNMRQRYALSNEDMQMSRERLGIAREHLELAKQGKAGGAKPFSIGELSALKRMMADQTKLKNTRIDPETGRTIPEADAQDAAQAISDTATELFGDAIEVGTDDKGWPYLKPRDEFLPRQGTSSGAGGRTVPPRVTKPSGGRTVVGTQPGIGKNAGKTKIIYSDGTSEIVDHK